MLWFEGRERLSSDMSLPLAGLLFAAPSKGWVVRLGVDLLYLNGEDLRGRPLAERKRLLSDLLAGDVIRYAEHIEDGQKLLQAAADMRLEGIRLLLTLRRLVTETRPAVLPQLKFPRFRQRLHPRRR